MKGNEAVLQTDPTRSGLKGVLPEVMVCRILMLIYHLYHIFSIDKQKIHIYIYT